MRIIDADGHVLERELPWADLLEEPYRYFVVDDSLLVDGGRRLRYAIEELGEEQLFFGSDYPHMDGNLDSCAFVKGLDGISAETKEKILGGNAMTLLGGKLPG